MIGLAVLAMIASEGPPAAATRDLSLIDAFEVFCELDTLSFDQLDRKYMAMKLPVVQDIRLPENDGRSGRSKSWLGALKDGPFQLLATEVRNPNGVATEACGVSALDSGGESFRSALKETLKLPQPDAEKVLPNGLRASVWHSKSGGRLVLVDAVLEQKPGFILTTESPSPNAPAAHPR